MSLQALTLYGTGLVCGVGLNSAAACAAIRAGINNFQETRFMDKGGEWIMGCEVPLVQPWRGRNKLVKMAAMAIGECLANSELNVNPAETPLLLCVAESERPGKPTELGNELLEDLQKELGVRFHEKSCIIPQGRVAGAVALFYARKMLHEDQLPRILIVGVDSLLTGPTLLAYQERDRLLTSKNSNGFIPGEAAAAILLGKPEISEKAMLHCLGMGFGVEKATVESEGIPLRADGLSLAIKNALNEASCTLMETDFRITDLSGEQYYFKEAALCLSRTFRGHKDFYDIRHPADCMGEVGAAIGPAMLITLQAALQKDYASGDRVLAHMGSDNGKRAALILSYKPVKAS